MGDGMLKEKEEVQEYLKNLGIEYRYSCFGEKNPEGCQLLGDYLSQITQEYEKSNRVFKTNCEENKHGRSCSSYAMHVLYGKGCKKNFQEAVDYFAKACELNDASGCDFAGKMLTNCEKKVSKHIQLDPARGLRYLEKGCNLTNCSQMFESSESCYAAAFLHAAGINGVPRNEEAAVKLAAKACDLGQINGCRLAGQVLTKLGKTDVAEKFENRYKELKKQVTDNVQIEMQRT